MSWRARALPRVARARERRLQAWLAAVAALAVAQPLAPARAASFETRPIPIATEKIFDLGAVDYDSDGSLDLFTTNHRFLQVLLRNDRTGTFQDRLSAARLNQTPSFPGYEDLTHPPPTASRGLYIYANEKAHPRIVANDLPVGTSGDLVFVSRVRATGVKRAEISKTRDDSTTPTRRTVHFETTAPDASFKLENFPTALPVGVRIDAPLVLSRVFVGAERVTPSARRFQLYLRDRHGMAWADLSGDRLTDIFITRGGLFGRIERFPGVVQDELLLGDGTKFTESIDSSGIRKGACAGRQATAADYDGDGRLDVFFSCEGGRPKLFRQVGPGAFANASGRLRRGGVHGMRFVWIDLRGGPRQELLAATGGRFAVYGYSGDRWRRRDSAPGRQEGDVRALAIADLGGDGDPDVFAASPTGNTLLVNREGRLRPRSPQTVGLPARSLTAAWLDYQNDGRLDLHALPGGLYRQTERGRFQRARIAGANGGIPNALAIWPDIDNDGARDGVLAVRRVVRGAWAARLLANEGSARHWLEVDLTGRTGNREAIGAAVRVKAGAREQTAWVGESDSSRYSQGHYRLYFGLGSHDRAFVRVEWPDGGVDRLGSVQADRVIAVSEGGGG